MAAPRWTTLHVTRVAGNPIIAADDNTELTRILTLADDIGGDPAVEFDGAASDIIDALNELYLFKPLPKLIPGSSFRPFQATDADSLACNDKGFAWNGSTVASNADIELIAPLDLPVGTVITNMKVHGQIVGDSAASIVFRLSRYEVDGGTYNNSLFSHTETGTIHVFHTNATGGPHTVAAGYNYVLYAKLTNNTNPSEAQLYGVEIS